MSKRNDLTYEQFQERFRYDPIKDRKGRGGQGVVYKAKDTHRNNRLVAIKKAEFENEHTSLMRETELVQKLPTHPNIVYYEECFRLNTPDGVFDYAILDYYEKGNLLDLNHEKYLGMEKKQFILTQLLEGIHFLHKNGITHRDLKPGNILIKPDRELYIPVITDFGISKDDIECNKNNSATIASLRYASPEQLKEGSEIDCNTDLWSFGIIALGLFLDTFPFTLETIAEIQQGTLPPAIDSLPKAWQILIKKCLIADPAKRIQSCEECKKILSEYPEPYFTAENDKKQEEDTERINSKSASEKENSLNIIADEKQNGNEGEDKIQPIKKKSNRQIRVMYIAIGIFAVLLLGVSSFFIDKFVNLPFTATIQIVDWKGSTQKENIDFIKESNIKIALCLGNKITDYKTIADNTIDFPNIPVKYKNEKIKIMYEPSARYPVLVPVDSLELKSGQFIDLKFSIKGNKLGKISGTINDEKNNPIKNAKIETKDTIVFSDNLGFYCIPVPIEKQELIQTITISKEKFITQKWKLDMITNEGYDFKLISQK